MQRILFCILISFFLHGFLLFLVGTRGYKLKPRDLTQIQFLEKSPGVQNKASSQSTSSKAGKRRLALQKFKFSAKDTIAENSSQNGEGRVKSAEWLLPESFATNELTDFAGRSMGEVKFLKSLWREIDKSIIDSDFLSEFGHTGKVVLAFEVTSAGELVENSLKAQAQNGILKVFAAKAVRKAVTAQNRDLVFPAQKSLIYAQFKWTSFEACEKQKGVHQNYLSFCKKAVSSNRDFSATERTMTYLSSLQYGFGALEKIKKYQREEFRRNTKFDPFEALRRDPDYYL